MRGLMMQFPLTIGAMMRHAATVHAERAIVSRRPDRSLHRYRLGECLARARRLGHALRALGLQPGDRVATLAWTHHQHLEAYCGVPAAGLVLHTLNLRLHPDELAYVVNHAQDRALIVDDVLWPLFERIRDRVNVEHVIVVSESGNAPPGTIAYEALLAAAHDGPLPDVEDENEAAGLCYTSGTTGRPKGVLYSHRALVLHAMAIVAPDGIGLSANDVILPVVPMFHANAWGIPHATLLTGCSLALPGPHLDARSLVELMAEERVTLSAGVPTISMAILQFLDEHPGEYDLTCVRKLLVGGAAPAEALIRALEERHGLKVQQGWGMTETSPVGSTTAPRPGHAAPDYAFRATAGMPAPFVEIRARSEDGLVPWDGETMGELEVRGPWVVARYYENDDEDARAKFTDDGWFRTGDIVTIGPDANIRIRDRAKDLVKSGGEWISSVELENHLMAHPAVVEAAVVGIPHPKWEERPLAVIVVRAGATADPASLQAHLAERFARWWIPESFVVADALPKGSTGKVLKTALRETYRDHYAATLPAPGGSASPVA